MPKQRGQKITTARLPPFWTQQKTEHKQACASLDKQACARLELSPWLRHSRNAMDSNRGEFPLDHGSIFFKMHRADEDAEFIRCRSKVDKKKLVNHALTTWNLPSSPGVMLRICGTLVSSARSRSSEANDDFVTTLEGVLKAADTAGAWMFSTGLDFGMAAAVGMTLGRSRHNCACPLIGFTEWDVVQGKDQIQRGIGGKPPEKGSKRIYTDCQPNDDMSTCSLQANHTHYVLVGGKGDEDYSAPDPNKSKAQQLLEARKRSFTFAHDFDRTMSLSDGVNNRKGDERIPRKRPSLSYALLLPPTHLVTQQTI